MFGHGEWVVKRPAFFLLFLSLATPSLNLSNQSSPQASTAASPAQESSSETVIKTTTRAVVLDVVVTDRAGLPVQGLTKADFTILEDGQQQGIASFEPPLSRPASAPQMTVPVEAPPSSASPGTAQVILLIDEMNSTFKDLAYARYCLGKLLRRNGGHLQQAASLMALTNDGLLVLHDSTLDGNALRLALDRHQPQLPWRLSGGVYGATERLNISLGALERIAAAGVGARAPRNIVWISPGLPILSSIAITPDSRDRAFVAIRNLSDELLRARATVYTVDPRGVPESSGMSFLSATGVASVYNATYWQILSQSNNANFGDLALQHFAKETGGRSFWGHNGVDAEIARSIVEGSTSYTLSYYPTNTLYNGKFRKIAVTVNRSSLVARTRDGYFATPDPPPPDEDKLIDQIEIALANPLPYQGIPISGKAAILPGDPQHLQVVLTGDRRVLTWTGPSGNQQCQLIVAAAAYSSLTNEKPLRIQREDFSYVLPAADSSSRTQKPVVYTLTFPIDANVKHIRVLLRDKISGLTGTADLRAPFSPADPATKP